MKDYSEDSILHSITMTRSAFNFLLFNGFTNLSSSDNRTYSLDVERATIILNFGVNRFNVFEFGPFIDENDTRIRILNSMLLYNIFAPLLGTMILARNSMKAPISV